MTTRQETLVDLKVLFQCHQNLLQENLEIVIKKVAEKMTDSEPSVRQSLLLFLCFIFPMVPQQRMAPFLSLIIAHLSCAMTHIYDDIQHDSLAFLELSLLLSKFNGEEFLSVDLQLCRYDFTSEHSTCEEVNRITT